MNDLTAGILLEDMTDAERPRMERIESVLPTLREHATEVDLTATFRREHITEFSEAGLLGLIIPEEYGGLGGGLRDLTAATFAIGTACPSTSLAFFFHCSSASRGLLALEAIDAGLFTDEEVPVVRAFAEKVLNHMGREGLWLANFASESVKSSKAKISIATTATRVDGGWSISGVKAFGCATGVADRYLVTAARDDVEGADGLSVFLVDRDNPGVAERAAWDAVGMRGTATHGIVLTDAFVPDADALVVPGSFVRMMQMSRGSFVGNQVAGTAVYAGAALTSYREAIKILQTRKFADTGEPLGSTPFHQQLIGEMTNDVETAMMWLRRQVTLETANPPLISKDDVIKTWRLTKGNCAEAAHRVAITAIKACGTSATGNTGVLARNARDCMMGLVQAFPAERGRLEAANMAFTGSEETQFASAKG